MIIVIKGNKASDRKALVTGLTAAIAVMSFLSIVGPFPISESMAQQNMQQNSSSSTNTRQLNVTIDAIRVNTDHDPLFSGEWVMDAYVNDWWLPLIVGEMEVDDGDIINFTEGNNVVVSVPNTEDGDLRILTVGFEDDGLPEVLPILTPLLINSTFPSAVFISQDIVEEFVRFDANDPNGFVAERFTAEANFGIGEHRICSQRNIQATDPQNWWESACDFELFLKIEEVK